MKFVDEFRQAEVVRSALDRVRQTATQTWTLMEVCGGQTHSLLRYGLVQLLQPQIQLIHGPGCPVCVTDSCFIDSAIQLAHSPGITVATFGDLMRVPGNRQSLLTATARGAQVLTVYSPIDAVRYAASHLDTQVVFFAVGFETTVPSTALAALQAERLKLKNFSILNAHVRVLPAMKQIAQDPACSVDGFLAAGHVCSITGWSDYHAFAKDYRRPVVVTGFEPLDLLHGIETCVSLLEKKTAQAVNAYERAVTIDGSPQASEMIARVFKPADRRWRGLGVIPLGGFQFQDDYAWLDAATRFGQVVDSVAGPEDPKCESLPDADSASLPVCLAAEILTGKRKPCDCPEFARACTPDSPLGAPMVSSEGACAAWYRYRSHET
jgi:hydrogenase expression/formation protein HypD